MRIRDKIFPEGTKTRKVLRGMAHAIKGFKPTNMKKVFHMIKTEGMKSTLKTIKQIIVGNNQYMDRNIDYQKWLEHVEPTKKEIEEQRKVVFKIQPKISILVPMYNTPYNFFKELVECLINQTYTNWELCLADGSPEQDQTLKKIYEQDERIKYK